MIADKSIHKSTEDTLMTFDRFAESPVFYELKEHWGRKEKKT